ncbi:MAG: hypothetical protein J6Y86_01405 [Pseudobutyrivibrio sp.]|nr:hypothetical protein [Pseudobutyrivibrio sp.]
MKYTKHIINSSTDNIIFAINNYINGFKAYRNRMILKSRLIDGLTFEELAEKYDMSVRQIKKIVYDSEVIISEHLRVEE